MCTCSIKLQYNNNLKNEITLHIVDGSSIMFVHVKLPLVVLVSFDVYDINTNKTITVRKKKFCGIYF